MALKLYFSLNVQEEIQILNEPDSNVLTLYVWPSNFCAVQKMPFIYYSENSLAEHLYRNSRNLYNFVIQHFSKFWNQLKGSRCKTSISEKKEKSNLITCSSHVFTNPETLNPELISIWYCFFRENNEISFRIDQNKFGIRENNWWARY